MIERTLVLLKPDAVQRGVMGRIISRFEDAGLKIIGAKMVWVDEKFAQKHYFDVAERHGEKVLKILVGAITEGPILALVLEGINAIENTRKLVGDTYPGRSLPGTIRGDFAHVTKEYSLANDKPVKNLVHASAKPEDAKIELALWFTPKEMHTYKTVYDIHILG